MPDVEFEVRGAVRDLFLSRDSELCIVGAAGTGKSNGALMRLHLLCLQYPGIRCLIVRKTHASLASTTLVTFNKKVAKEMLANRSVRWYGGSANKPPAYLYSNGSEIVVGGMNDPGKVMSAEYDIVFADESTELTVEDWELARSRLRNGVLPWQAQWAACNPGPPTHWLKQRSNDGQLRMLTSLHRDNPAYYTRDGRLTTAGAAYMDILDGLTGVRRSRLLHGQWAAADGLVYEDWNDAVHLVDKFDVPESWPRYMAVDFGYTNPMVVQWWAVDPDGRAYLYREIYKTQTLVEDMARLALSFMQDRHGKWTEPKPKALICDHDAEGRATLARHLKMSTRAADKRVKIGIQQVQSRLRVAGDGRPRLMIMRDCTVKRDRRLIDAKKPASTAEEITGYVWLNNDKKEDTVEKTDDHGCDTMRYLIMHIDPPSRLRKPIQSPAALSRAA